MGSYFSFNLRLLPAEFPTTAFLGLRSLPHFDPASLGAVEGHEQGDHWFLSGYALEDFVRRFIEQSPAKPASIELVPAGNRANAAYLESIANALHGGVSWDLSPFEQISESDRITFLDDVAIGETEIQKCLEWSQSYSAAVAYLYGAITLSTSTQARPALPWKRAFRELIGSKEIGPPFVLLRAGRAPLATSQMEVAVFSSSTVWFDNDNLSRLAAIVEAVITPLQGRIKRSWLTLEGGVFREREGELTTALLSLMRGFA
ncbi:MAG: hypothetical protein JO015_21630 [Verrucomicrobia bacterium]|nr:hypothetical protein [Verrucomicrobiota bacterium]